MSPRLFALSALALLLPAPVAAQQVTVSTPFHSVNNSFFEQQGINFGANIHAGNPNGTGTRVVGLLPNGQFTPNGDIQFRQNFSGAAVPQFGQPDPTTTATAGVAILGKKADLFFGLNFGEGSTTTNTVQTPMITLMNGGTGTFSDQTQTPFVTSVTPIVGGWGPGPQFSISPQGAAALAPSVSPLVERLARLRSGEQGPSPGAAAPGAAGPPRQDTFGDQLDSARQSTAGRPALSIAEITQQRAQVDEAAQQAAQDLLERGRRAEEADKPGLAKVYYRMAAKQATGSLKEEAEKKLHALSGKSSPASAAAAH